MDYGWSNYGPLYDQYRINKAVLRFWTLHNTFPVEHSSAAANQGNSKPHIYSYVDCDDNAAPSDFKKMMQRGNLRRHRTILKFQIKWTPGAIARISEPVSGGHFDNIMYKKWIDVNTDTLNFNGVKTGLIMPVNAATLNLYYQAIIYVSFKNKR